MTELCSSPVITLIEVEISIRIHIIFQFKIICEFGLGREGLWNSIVAGNNFG
jgi:hypothetical protein